MALILIYSYILYDPNHKVAAMFKLFLLLFHSSHCWLEARLGVSEANAVCERKDFDQFRSLSLSLWKKVFLSLSLCYFFLPPVEFHLCMLYILDCEVIHQTNSHTQIAMSQIPIPKQWKLFHDFLSSIYVDKELENSNIEIVCVWMIKICWIGSIFLSLSLSQHFLSTLKAKSILVHTQRVQVLFCSFVGVLFCDLFNYIKCQREFVHNCRR